MAEFVARFHDLAGTNQSEHYRNFNYFLNDLLKDATVDHEEFFGLLKSKNRQEEIFRIALLQRFKRHRELLEILQRGDHIYCLKVIKDRTFFDIFNDISARVFIDEICPNISFSVRLKVLNRLSVYFTDCRRAENYFECVKDRYGLKVAKVLLIACSEEFVKEAVEVYDLNFNQRQLVQLHCKYPEFIRFYFNHNVGFTERNQYLGRHLALNDMDTYSILAKRCAIKIGTAGYIKYLSNEENRREFLNNPKFFINSMVNRLPHKILNPDEYKQFLLKFLPESPFTEYCYDYQFQQYLKFVPRKARGELLFALFNECYGFEPTTEYITKDMLKMLDAESVKKFDLDDDHIVFLPVEKSIPLIKEMIENTEDKDSRGELLQKLVETCKFNNSDDGLLEVLKYFCSRHKNSIGKIRSTFSYALVGEFKLERLSLEHWSYISMIIRLFEINLEDCYCMAALCQSYIHFKYLHKLDYTYEAKLLWQNSGFMFCLYDDMPRMAHDFYVTLLGVIADIGKDKEERQKRSIELLSKIIHFNDRHKKHIVNFDLYKHLLETLGDDPRKYYANIEWLLNSTEKSMIENREYLLELLAKKNQETLGYEHYSRFLKYRQDLLLKNKKYLFKNQALVEKIAYNISKMQYIQMHDDLVDYAMSIIENDELNVEHLTSSLILLAYCKPEALKLVVEKYQPPKDGKIDVHDEKMKDILTVQKWILKSLRHVSDSKEILPLLLPFCKGDYNTLSIDTVYCVLTHLPEKYTMEVVLKLKIKEQIRLSNFISSTKIRNDIITNMLNAETKSNVKKLIFDKIKSALQSERSQFEFDLLKRNISLVDPNNKESLAAIIAVDNIPKHFYSEYVELIWNYLKTFEKSYEIDLIPKVDSKKLNETLTRQIITASLFRVDKKKRQGVLDFTKEAVLNSPNLIDTIPLNEPMSDPKALYELIESICREVLSASSKRTQEEKVKIVDGIHKPSSDPLITQMLDLTHFWVHLTPRKDLPPLSSCTTPPPMQSLASFLISRVKTITEKYTNVAVEFYALFLKNFLKNILKANDDSDENIKYTDLGVLMLDEDDSEVVRLLVLGLVRFEEYNNPRVTELQAKIRAKVENGASDLVKLMLIGSYYAV